MYMVQLARKTHFIEMGEALSCPKGKEQNKAKSINPFPLPGSDSEILAGLFSDSSNIKVADPKCRQSKAQCVHPQYFSTRIRTLRRSCRSMNS
jgi:hypothetical protein